MERIAQLYQSGAIKPPYVTQFASAKARGGAARQCGASLQGQAGAQGAVISRRPERSRPKGGAVEGPCRHDNRTGPPLPLAALAPVGMTNIGEGIVKVGSIGVGNMGGPMCRNIVKKQQPPGDGVRPEPGRGEDLHRSRRHRRQVGGRGHQGRRRGDDLAAHAQGRRGGDAGRRRHPGQHRQGPDLHRPAAPTRPRW